MGIYTKRLPNMTFTGASTTSNAITLFDDCRGLGIYITSASGAITHTVQVEPSTGGSAWVDLQSGAADVTLTTSECLVIEPAPFRQLRLLGTGTSTGTTAQVVGQFVI